MIIINQNKKPKIKKVLLIKNNKTTKTLRVIFFNAYFENYKIFEFKKRKKRNQ